MTSLSNPPELDTALAKTPETQPTQTLTVLSTTGLYSLAIVFNLCLILQLLTVGLAYFADPDWWMAHQLLVRSYSGLTLLLLIWAYVAPFPKRIRILTASLPILLGLQFLSIHVQTPLPFPLAIFHPLIGFSLVSVSATLVHRLSALRKQARELSA